MTQRTRLVLTALGLILGLLSAPLAGLAAPADAMPCCASETPGSDEAPCGPARACPSMIPMTCCSAQPAAPSAPASGAVHGPLAQAIGLAFDAGTPPDASAREGHASAAIAARASPRTLSVVIRV